MQFAPAPPSHSGLAKGKGKSSTRNLEEVGAASEHHVVIGNFTDPSTNQTSSYFATNATIAEAENFRVGFAKTEECSDEAHNNALITQISEERRIITNTTGAKGWHLQRVTQIEDDEVPALNEFIAGTVDSNYTLVAFFYNLEKDLVACAHLKQHDKDTAAMYDELLKEVAAAKAAEENAGVAGAGIEAAASDTSSGSKNGLLAVVSSFAVVGIAVVMGGVLAF